jgi:hypothetical protein
MAVPWNLRAIATIVVCAAGCLSHLHLLPSVRPPDAVRARVQALRADLTWRWRCDTATRRALLLDGDAERLYADVEAACPIIAAPSAAPRPGG